MMNYSKWLHWPGHHFVYRNTNDIQSCLRLYGHKINYFSSVSVHHMCTVIKWKLFWQRVKEALPRINGKLQLPSTLDSSNTE